MEDFALATRDNLVMASGIVFEPGRGFHRRVALAELETGLVVDTAAWNVDEINDQRLALCPDRRLLALAPRDGGIRILDAWTGAETGRFDVGNRKVDRIVFARDGRRLAVETQAPRPANQDLQIQIIDLERKDPSRVIGVTGLRMEGSEFSPDGSTIAATADRELFVWDVASGQRLPYWRALDGPISYSADGRSLAAAGRSGRIGILDLPGRRLSFLFDTTKSRPNEVALSPDGRTLVTDGGSVALHSWDVVARRDRFAAHDAHSNPVETVRVTADGQSILTVARPDAIWLWDARTGRPRKRWNVPDEIYQTALSPDGGLLAAATFALAGIQLNIWEIAGGPDPIGRPIIPMAPGSWPEAVGFADAGRTIVIVSDLGKLHGWDCVGNRIKEMPEMRLAPPDRPERLRAMPLSVSSAFFLDGGKRLAADVIFGGLRIVEIATDKELWRTESGARMVLSPDEHWIALTESVDGRTLWRRQRPAGRAGPAGVMLRSESGVIRLVDAGTGQESRRMSVDGSEVWALAFSPDGKTLAATTGWETGRIHLLDIASGKVTRTIDSPPLHSPALAFTPDGARLVSGMADGSVLIWDVHAGR
jgi:WD40 repeat protein